MLMGYDYGGEPAQPPEYSPESFELASWGPRLGGILIDYLILSAINSMLMSVAVPLLLGAAGGMDAQQGQAPEASAGIIIAMVLVWGLALAIQVCYFIGFWIWKDGQTPGKMAVGARIVSQDGTPIGFGQAVLRYIGYMLSGIPCYLGFLWPLWDDENRAWHDMIAGTRVVRKK
jgi:uncharacterized RDD family membrane protein YckC